MDGTAATFWYRYHFTGCIPHCVCIELEKLLLRDLAARYSEAAGIVDVGRSTTWRFDPGGINMSRPVETFSWCGIEIWIPCENVSGMAKHLDELSAREFANGAEYYKLKAWGRCLVMTPTHKAALLEALRARQASAEALANAFYAELDRRDKNS